MDDKIKKFIDESKKTRMSPTEKSRMLGFLLTYVSKTEKLVPSPYTFMGIMRKSRLGVAVALFLILITAGTSHAADQALPGDALYPVKVNINEEFQNLVTFGASAKARLALAHAEERLEEAETLSVQGRLNSNTQAIILSNFTEHADDIKANVAQLALADDKTEANDVSSQFQSSVKAHSQILKVLSQNDATQTAIVDSLVSQVSNQANTVADIATTTDATSSIATSTTAVNAKMQEAANDISLVNIMYQNTALSNDVLSKIKISIQAANDLFAQGKSVYSNGVDASSTTISIADAASAINLFSQAETKTEETKAIIQLFLQGSGGANQVLNAIPNSILTASSTVSSTKDSATTSDSSVTATSTIQDTEATSTTSTSSVALVSSSSIQVSLKNAK